MKFQTNVRLIPVLLGSMLIASIFACGRPTTENEVARYGDDVLVWGSDPDVADSVPGDVGLAGDDIRFSGTTGGDYLGAGGTQHIRGRIYGSVRAAGGEIHMGASVDRNVTIAGGEVHLDSAAVVSRNAYLAGGLVQVDGTVQDVLHAAGGNVVLNGRVGRDVEIYAGSLRIGPNAEIGGNLRYRVPKEKVSIDSSARIAGTITALPVPEGRGAWYLLGVLWTLGFLVTGLVLVALVPRFAAETVQILRERPGPSGLAGLGWIILMPIAITIMAITIIGLPLALLTGAIYAALIYMGRIVFATWLGQRLLGARVKPGRQGMLLSFLVGALVLLFVEIIPVLGALVMILATLIGLGALLFRIWAMRAR